MNQENNEQEEIIEKNDTAQTEKQNQMTTRAFIKEVLSWVVTIAAAVALALFLNRVILINATIPSGSMENTIMEDDRLLGLRLAYRNHDPQRGDIIIFKYPDKEEENYIKRIIGLPGETVDIKDAKIYINGSDTPLDEPYLKEEWVIETGPYHFEVPENSYLVLGDNRNNSLDARYWNNTYVSRDKILGKAWFRYYPFHSIGKLQ